MISWSMLAMSRLEPSLDREQGHLALIFRVSIFLNMAVLPSGISSKICSPIREKNRPPVPRGVRDLNYSMTISFNDAIQGLQTKIKVNRLLPCLSAVEAAISVPRTAVCPDCGGSASLICSGVL
jgi:DnaJ-class molecular chaperone